MNLKLKAIERNARRLKNLGCEFMIVPGGDMKPLVNGKFSHHKRVPRGICNNYVEGFIKDLMPGDSVTIPLGEFPRDTLQSVVSALCFKHFGKGNYISGRTADETGIEVLCIAHKDEDDDFDIDMDDLNNTTGEE